MLYYLCPYCLSPPTRIWVPAEQWPILFTAVSLVGRPMSNTDPQKLQLTDWLKDKYKVTTVCATGSKIYLQVSKLSFIHWKEQGKMNNWGGGSDASKERWDLLRPLLSSWHLLRSYTSTQILYGHIIHKEFPKNPKRKLWEINQQY